MIGSENCANCGAALAPDMEECSVCGKRQHHEHTYVHGRSVCAVCGAYNSEGTELCNSCKTPMRDVIRANLPDETEGEECRHWSDEPASAGRAAKVSVAGILVLIAGMLGIAQATLALTPGLGDDFLALFEGVIPGMEAADNFIADYILLQIAIFLSGTIAIFGSMFTLNQSKFRVSVIGAVFGIFAIGLLLGAFFSLIGLILIITSRKQFLSECG